jgi:hypothetical protein
MSVTLSQILTLVGPLDDSQAFDAPRERFRRFLTDNVTDVAALRALVEEAQRMVGEQPHRALQDAIVVLGRFLGFETTFGTYQRLAGAVQFEGQWRSRHHLHVLLEIRSEQTERADPDDLTRALAALAANSLDDAPRIGLSVFTPLFAARGRLEEEQLASNSDRRIVSTRSLLWLAEAVSDHRMKHDEVVRLLLSGHSLDTIVQLFERFSGAALASVPDRAAERAVEHAEREDHSRRPLVGMPGERRSSAGRSFWVVTADRSESGNFEQLVYSAVAKRQVLGVVEDRTLPAVAAPGDAVCFFVSGKGIVGHAEIGAAAEPGLHLIRDSDRFSRLYRVKDVVVYEVPIVPDVEMQQTLTTHHQRTGLPGPLLVPVSERRFESLTTGPAPLAEPAGPRPAAWPALIDRASRSRA